MAGRLAELQRSAGNRAVVVAVSGAAQSAALLPAVVQREGSEPAGGVSTPGQQGASTASGQVLSVWDKLVVFPLARAADRIGRDQPDLKGARADLVAALTGIAAVRDGTPTDDRNRTRFEIVERIVRGVVDLVDQRADNGKSDHQIDNDFINARVEATKLKSSITHMPDLAQFVGKDETPRAMPPSEAWQILVIDSLWNGQRNLAESRTNAALSTARAANRIRHFHKATPEGHPNRLPLLRLLASVESIQNLLVAGDKTLAGNELVEQGQDAYDAANNMREFLGGRPAEAATGEPAGEPSFTWERASAPDVHDTDLEKPGEDDAGAGAGPRPRTPRQERRSRPTAPGARRGR